MKTGNTCQNSARKRYELVEIGPNVVKVYPRYFHHTNSDYFPFFYEHLRGCIVETNLHPPAQDIRLAPHNRLHSCVEGSASFGGVASVIWSFWETLRLTKKHTNVLLLLRTACAAA
ncbi:unnamed protein product [Sphacelaria rigidula]